MKLSYFILCSTFNTFQKHALHELYNYASFFCALKQIQEVFKNTSRICRGFIFQKTNCGKRTQPLSPVCKDQEIKTKSQEAPPKVFVIIFINQELPKFQQKRLLRLSQGVLCNAFTSKTYSFANVLNRSMKCRQYFKREIKYIPKHKLF